MNKKTLIAFSLFVLLAIIFSCSKTDLEKVGTAVGYNLSKNALTTSSPIAKPVGECAQDTIKWQSTKAAFDNGVVPMIQVVLRVSNTATTNPKDSSDVSYPIYCIIKPLYWKKN